MGRKGGNSTPNCEQRKNTVTENDEIRSLELDVNTNESNYSSEIGSQNCQYANELRNALQNSFSTIQNSCCSIQQSLVRMGTPDESSEENTCSICLSEFVDGEEIMHTKEEKSCNHRFHKSCLLEWLDAHSLCPMCRFEMVTEKELAETRIHL